MQYFWTSSIFDFHLCASLFALNAYFLLLFFISVVSSLAKIFSLLRAKLFIYVKVTPAYLQLVINIQPNMQLMVLNFS